jgi:hypothetical protein
MNASSRNLLIVVLALAVGVLGFLYYQQRERAGSVDINVGKQGLTIQKN